MVALCFNETQLGDTVAKTPGSYVESDLPLRNPLSKGVKEKIGRVSVWIYLLL